LTFSLNNDRIFLRTPSLPLTRLCAFCKKTGSNFKEELKKWHIRSQMSASLAALALTAAPLTLFPRVTASMLLTLAPASTAARAPMPAP
jgi:hypothetical protein